MQPFQEIEQLRRYLRAKGRTVNLMKGGSGLKDIQSLELQQLDASHAWIIKKQCKNLEKIKVWTSCAVDTITALSYCQSLTDLSVYALSSPIAKDLVNLRNLRKFHIMFPQQSLLKNPNHILQYFPQIESFGVIKLINEEVINTLKHLNHLRELIFDQAKLSTAEIRALMSTLPNLTSISITIYNLTDEHFMIICEKIDALESLQINCSSITNQGLEPLRKHEGTLKKLSFNSNIIVDSLFQFLVKFKALTSLKMQVLQFSKEMNLLPLYLKSLQSFGVVGSLKSKQLASIDQFIKHAVHLKQLQVHKIYTNKTLQVVAENTPHVKSLSAYFGMPKGVVNSGCCYVSKLKDLRDLALYYNDIGTVGIDKMIRNLSHVNIQLYSNREVSQKCRRNARLLDMNGQMSVSV